MTPDQPQPLNPFPILRASTTLLLWCVGALVVVGGGLWVSGRVEQAMWCAVAAAVCGGAGLIGFVPIWALSRAMPHGAAQGFLFSILFRLLTAGGALFVLPRWLNLPDSAWLSVWIGAWYLLVLIIEVRLVAAHVMRPAPRPADNTQTVGRPAAGVVET